MKLIHRGVMNYGNVPKWFRLCHEGMTNSHDKALSGRPVKSWHKKFRQNRRFAIEFCQFFYQILRSMCYQLHYKKKVCKMGARNAKERTQNKEFDIFIFAALWQGWRGLESHCTGTILRLGLSFFQNLRNIEEWWIVEINW